jgi:predicted Zn-dependent protease with MMP-like domain
VPVQMSPEEFEGLVQQALDNVPAELLQLVENCVILVEDAPPPEMEGLLGLYDGVPLTERGDFYGGVLPDRILIFRLPTLEVCDDLEEVMEEVHITVVHEIAHHFGIDDDRLHELGWS